MSEDEKTCPRCAELVKAEAQACRFCGHEFGSSRPPAAARKPRIGVAGGCLLTLFGLVLLGSIVGPPPEDSTAPVATARDPAPCDAAIADARRTRIVRRVRGNRIDVEDVSWRLAAAEDKRALMALFLCSYLRGRPPSGFDDFVVAYGYRSGHRVAMASEYGVNLE